MIARIPFGVLALDIGMVLGVVSLLKIAAQRVNGSKRGDAWFLALGSFLPIPFLSRFLAAQSGLLLPPVLRLTWLLEAVVLGAVLGLILFLQRTHSPRTDHHVTLRRVALTGAALSVGLFALAVVQSPGVPWSAVVVWSATGLFVGLALLAQRLASLRARGTRWETLGTAAALFLAATQLLDGIVSYLSVRDPLGVFDVNFSEQVAVSAWLLEHTGPGYALAKWLLAVLVVYAVDARVWPARPEPTNRAAVYLFVALIGIGPGLFSATRLIA